MADPRHYSISIIENYSDKPLQEIALAVAKKIEKDISEDDFTLEDVEELELGTNFLTTEEAYTWYFVADDLAPMFADFPDTCFCLSVSDGEGGGQYRVLFFMSAYWYHLTCKEDSRLNRVHDWETELLAAQLTALPKKQQLP
ncbi:hypothetical protein [Pseudanabaena phage PA-SR01]|nr:hypothetical protein [Pseudanabaena phage PA-SR01]